MCFDRVGEVYQYIVEKYGENYVCKIGTYSKSLASAILKDVARIKDYDYNNINNLTKLIPANVTSLEKALELKEFSAAVKSDEKLKEVVDIAIKLEGGNRHTSEHAAGVIISPLPLNTLIPLKNDASQLDMKDLEEYGLVKMDLLKLRTLTVIKNTLNILKAKGIEINIDELEPDDPKVFELFKKGETIAVFQFESSGIQQMLKMLNDITFDDVVAVNAGYRPGPLDFRDEETGMTMMEQFIVRKNGEQETKYDHPLLEPVLRSTFGVILYQEELMEITRVLAGYSLLEADNMRRIVGK